MTTKGALAGIIVGGSTVLIWKNFFASTGLYEIIPGFILSLAAIVVVSLLDREPPKEMTDHYDEAVRTLQNEA